jgi:formate dehydrogenase maturation protein FdhE
LGWRGFSKALWRSRTNPTVRPEWPVTLRTAVGDLERLIGSRPELESPGRSLARVLEAAFGEPAVTLIPAFEDGASETEQRMQRIHEAWKNGQPALHCVTPNLEAHALAERALSIARTLRSEESRPAHCLCAFLEREPERVVDWIKLVLGTEDDFSEFELVTHSLGLEPALVDSVLRLVLLPRLALWSQQVCVHLTEGIWPSGQCPICGSGPALAESRGLEQRRRLRCDRCAADWPGEHFRCPFCGESDHRVLRYTFVQGEQDRYRLSICDRCGGRIKIMATLAPLSPPGLLVAEMASIHLELIENVAEPDS